MDFVFWEVGIFFNPWLDWKIQGLASLLRLGTTSFFIAMVGFTKVIMVTVISVWLGNLLAWYSGFWSLAYSQQLACGCRKAFRQHPLIIFIGGSTIALSHERVIPQYILCTVQKAMWGELSFLSSDILTYFLQNITNEQGSYYSIEQDRQTQRSDQFYGEPSHSSPAADALASWSLVFLQLMDVMPSQHLKMMFLDYWTSMTVIQL